MPDTGYRSKNTPFLKIEQHGASCQSSGTTCKKTCVQGDSVACPLRSCQQGRAIPLKIAGPSWQKHLFLYD